MKREDGLHSSGHAYRDELRRCSRCSTGALPPRARRVRLPQGARGAGAVRRATQHRHRQRTDARRDALRNSQTHGLLGNMHLLGEAPPAMFNDGGKGSGTSEDLAVEEHAHHTEGIVVVDLEVFDGALRAGRMPSTRPRTAPRGYDKTGRGFMAGRARVTSRSMWTDEGRLLAHLREAAEKSVRDSRTARARAVERTAASAVRFACRNYCNKRPDIIVVAHRGAIDPESQRRLQRAKAEETPEGGTVGASGTKYRPRGPRDAVGGSSAAQSDGPKGDGRKPTPSVGPDVSVSRRREDERGRVSPRGVV